MTVSIVETKDILDAKILIVDDQPLNVALLEHVLTSAGYANLTSTTDPRQAVGLHREHRYDLILLDIEMPRMDGFKVMEGLWAIEKESYLPVVAITANPDHKLTSMRAGARDFITKPFDLAEVLMRVHNFLEVRLMQRMANERSQQLESLALTDELTGLANRRLLDDRISKAIAYSRRHDCLTGVLYLDLDGFKQINDTMGHAAGDALLQEIAKRLVGAVRGVDTVSRLGGDEFVIALGQLRNAEDAGRGAEKVLAAIAQPFHIEGSAVQMTASVGISLYPQDGDSNEALLRSADEALYRAKDAGKNTYRFAKSTADA